MMAIFFINYCVPKLDTKMKKSSSIQILIGTFLLVSCTSMDHQNIVETEKSFSNSPPKIENSDIPDALLKEAFEQLMTEMIWVEGGQFKMGSDSSDARNRERPLHTVTLDGFYIGATEVKQALFELVMGGHFSYFRCDTCPVNNISWLQIQRFIQELNRVTGKHFRLPTEAEWEYAAKGGKKSKGYVFSGSNNIDEVAWFAGNANNKSQPAATKKSNELGLYDMTGNLWEFCQDDMSRTAYRHTPEKNPVYLRSNSENKVTMKVIRGGGYEFLANESKVYMRDGATNNVRMPDIGFRLVLDEN